MRLLVELKRITWHIGGRFYINSVYPKILRRRVKAVSQKPKIEVVFFAANLAMWRYQGIYELLSKEERFNCHIVISVFNNFSQEQQVADVEQLRNYFRSKGVDYLDYDTDTGRGYDVLNKINPDILFYPQSSICLAPGHCYVDYMSKLFCYVPYSFSIREDDWVYDTPYQNIAWKQYYPFKFNKDISSKVAKNHGRNMVVSGYPNLDRYLSHKTNDVWKIQDKSVKRLIWAPHYTIRTVEEGAWFSQSNFLWMAQVMLDIAEQYNGKLQIAFKPHPKLKSELYDNEQWGKERTERYYAMWDEMENTFAETGDFVDLFKTSDAMLHDSASFITEYLFVNKPVAFVTADVEHLMAEHSDFGRSALQQHYMVKDKESIIAFIENVVLGGNDTMKEQRTRFFKEVLCPNVTGSTSQIIVDDIKQSLGIK